MQPVNVTSLRSGEDCTTSKTVHESEKTHTHTHTQPRTPPSLRHAQFVDFHREANPHAESSSLVPGPTKGRRSSPPTGRLWCFQVPDFELLVNPCSIDFCLCSTQNTIGSQKVAAGSCIRARRGLDFPQLVDCGLSCDLPGAHRTIPAAALSATLGTVFLRTPAFLSIWNLCSWVGRSPAWTLHFSP